LWDIDLAPNILFPVLVLALPPHHSSLRRASFTLAGIYLILKIEKKAGYGAQIFS
jgi:hypothetical protein